jgi:hypothetical protein
MGCVLRIAQGVLTSTERIPYNPPQISRNEPWLGCAYCRLEQSKEASLARLKLSRCAGPLPDAVQNVTSYDAAAFALGPHIATAKALANYFATPDARKIFAETGID